MTVGATGRRQVGIALLGSEAISEGVDRVLANLVDRAGATALSIGRNVVRPSTEGTGRHEPPSDGGASVRVLDRPLFGHTAGWVQGAPTWRSRPEHYRDSPYQPPAANEVTDSDGPYVSQLVRAAADRGLRCSMQIGGSTPRGLRDEDLPRLPDGRLPDGMVRTGSLASPSVRAWNAALVRDVAEAWPDLAEIRIDYAEVPCYTLDEALTDFSDHVRVWCDARAIDFERIRSAVGSLQQHLSGGLTNNDLQAVIADGPLVLAAQAGVGVSDLAAWLDLKRQLSADLVADWRRELTAAAGPGIGLSVNGFAHPYGAVTGFDPGALAGSVTSVVPKLYGMHWSMMIDFWARRLLADNPGLDERLVVTALARLAELIADDRPRSLADFGYPEPDEPHPVTADSLRRRVDAAVASAGDVPIMPLVHGYGPLADFRERLEAVAATDAAGVWINRYGYLSDDKLDAIGDVFGR